MKHPALSETTPMTSKIVTPDLRMMGDRILIIPSNEDGERATRGGLVIPATANSDRRLHWGEVVAVGPNARHIKAKDLVLYSAESGHEAEISGDTFLVLRERDIPAVADADHVSETGLYL
ncbi:MAG TPA: co-chaperone GroES [Acidimicrobiia bacterium]|nr:co-chaperone GroES [Acidimicrobiia bacterium]